MNKPQDENTNNKDTHFIELVSFTDHILTEMAIELLQSNDIPTITKKDFGHIKGVMEINIGPLGKSSILVPAAYYTDACELIKIYLSNGEESMDE